MQRLSLREPLHPKNEIIVTMMPNAIKQSAASPIDVAPRRV